MAELSALMKNYSLSEQYCNRTVSDRNLEEICRHYGLNNSSWKVLRSPLGMAPDGSTAFTDILSNAFHLEKATYHDFFFNWKRTKGSAATYKRLLNALVATDSHKEAHFVCSLLKQSKEAFRSFPAKPGTSKPVNYTRVGLRYKVHGFHVVARSSTW